MKKRLLLLLLPLLLTAASTRPPEKRVGKDYAVFFYVTKFQPGWQSLPDTKTEAEDLKSTLETQYGFEGKLVPNPTRQQIFDEIAAWNNRLGPHDQVLFFFSMHGYYDPESELGYLIAADGLYRDEYFKTWLDYNSLRPYFARCKAKHMLVALDACYSGSFGNIEKAPDRPAYDETQDCQTQIDATFNFRVRQYICAGNKDSKTPGKSLFAAKMLETLRQGSNSDTDGILHFDDLTYALGKVRNPEPVHGTFTGHAPGGEFVFVRKNACAQQPDRDGDTVPDTLDQCPDTWGSQPNGCPPEVSKGNDMARDLAAWKTAKERDAEAAYLDYLRQFPQGEFKELANQALRALEAAAAARRNDNAWEVATEKNTLDGFKKYLADFPNGLHRIEADAKIKALEKPDNMVLIRGGTFQMGSKIKVESDKITESKTSDGRRKVVKLINFEKYNQPVHKVTISDFYLSKYEVTVAEFKEFVDDTGYQTDAEKEGSSYGIEGNVYKEIGGRNWRNDLEGKSALFNHPVVYVSWNDAIAYCDWLNNKTGQYFRLPTEAEWEYAAGNGDKHTLYSWGNRAPNKKRGGNIQDVTAKENFPEWHIDTKYSDGYVFTSPVGSYDENEFGLFDMSGNVWEWCYDYWGVYVSNDQINPTGPVSGTSHIMRGGSFFSNLSSCRVANRTGYNSNISHGDTGFRLARTK